MSIETEWKLISLDFFPHTTVSRVYTGWQKNKKRKKKQTDPNWHNGRTQIIQLASFPNSFSSFNARHHDVKERCEGEFINSVPRVFYINLFNTTTKKKILLPNGRKLNTKWMAVKTKLKRNDGCSRIRTTPGAKYFQILTFTPLFFLC